MFRLWLLLAGYCLSGVASATHPTYLVREHTDLQTLPIVEDVSSNINRYKAVQSVKSTQVEEFPVSSLMDSMSTPVNAVLNMGSGVLSFLRWTLVNGIQVLLGIAMSVGLCAFTTACNTALGSTFRRTPAASYLDDLKSYFSEAYDRYNNL